MDFTSRLRSIVNSGAAKPVRELTYEPDDGYRTGAPLDLDRVADSLGGRRVSTRFGECLVIDRRYEAERWHGDIRIGDCVIDDMDALSLLDPGLKTGSPLLEQGPRTIFIDLETTGLSGGAGTLAFLVGCGYFDLGAFQVRQFLLTSHAGERALLAAVADFFNDTDLIVTYNGKTFDVPVMETRWTFHRMEMPLDGVPHFDMLHPARRLWKGRQDARSTGADEGGCRLSTLERVLFDVQRVGDVGGFEIPGRFFGFVRSGDPRPLEPVLEHNRIDLVSLAAVTARAARLAREGHGACRDFAEALALGKIFEKAELTGRAEACYRYACDSPESIVRADALYRLGVRLRRNRHFAEAAAVWRDLIEFTQPRSMRRGLLGELRQVAVEALAIHQEHRAKDLAGARELALESLEEPGRRSESVRHRLARLERKLARSTPASLPL
ncbi:MAG TPA: ribonuclease H-like domain-containing protein [Vicinamibacterales bacterium]|nr:ribonuclease H-like domain-containing protein [Vicinamibacterales bacterium]